MTQWVFGRWLRWCLIISFCCLLKDTSLVAVIGFEELFRKGQLIVADNYRAFEIYTAVAIVYLCLTLFSSQAFSRLELWMNPAKSIQKSKIKNRK